MLIPQYTIRWLLAVTAGCAVAFSVFGLAVRGTPWAIGVSLGIVALGVAFLVQAGTFAVVWVFSTVSAPYGRRRRRGGRSPFARHPFAVAPAEAADANPQRRMKHSDDQSPGAPILLE